MLCVCLATPDILVRGSASWVGNVRARWAWMHRIRSGRRFIGFRIRWYMIPSLISKWAPHFFFPSTYRPRIFLATLRTKSISICSVYGVFESQQPQTDTVGDTTLFGPDPNKSAFTSCFYKVNSFAQRAAFENHREPSVTAY